MRVQLYRSQRESAASDEEPYSYQGVNGFWGGGPQKIMNRNANNMNHATQSAHQQPPVIRVLYEARAKVGIRTGGYRGILLSLGPPSVEVGQWCRFTLTSSTRIWYQPDHSKPAN